MSQVEQPFLPSDHEEGGDVSSLCPEKTKNVRKTSGFGIKSRFQSVAFTLKTKRYEEAKVAIKNRFPLLEFVVHVVAVGTVVVLVRLNLTNTAWVNFEMEKNDARNRQLKGWQVMAKVHELFMLSSLSFIVFYYMRTLLVGEEGVPFGLLNATYQVGSPAMLYKGGAWIAGFFVHKRFALLLLAVCLLSIILGPSSAILMIPSAGWIKPEQLFPTENSVYYLPGSANKIWPLSLNDSAVTGKGARTCRDHNPFGHWRWDCPTAGYLDITAWFSNHVGTNSQRSVSFGAFLGGARRDTAVVCADDYCGMASDAYGTVATDLMTVAMGSYSGYAAGYNIGNINGLPTYRFSISKSTPTYQPVVHVRCGADSWRKARDSRNITFPRIQNRWNHPWGVRHQIPLEFSENSTIWDDFRSTGPKFHWMKDTETNSNASLLALAIVPTMESNRTGGPEDHLDSMYVACSIDARWFGSELSLSSQNSSISSNVTENLRNVLLLKEEMSYTKYGISDKPIDIELDYADHYLNPKMPDNSSALINILNLAMKEVKNKDVTVFKTPVIGSGHRAKYLSSEKAISYLLSLVLADGISRSPSVAELGLPYVMDRIYRPLGHSATSLIDTYANKTKDERKFHYPIRVEVDRYVHGFILQGRPARFALTALLIYAAAVCVHVAYVAFVMIRKEYYGGDCWEYVGELVALAINSSPSEKLLGTSAGIETRKLWENVVRVRSMKDEKLELCFMGDDKEEGESVRPGKKYL